MFKKLLLAGAFSLIASNAFAVCGAIPLPILDGGGVSRNISSKSGADGNCVTNIDSDASSVLVGAINSGVSPTAPGAAPSTSILIGGQFNTTAPTFTNTQAGALQLSNRGGLLLGNGYPAGSTPITISATGTTAATTATLATGASVTTYICGFSIRANATAAATANSTVTGTITGTLNYTQWTAPLASGIGITEQIFQPCIPASAVNTGIAVISAAPGSGGVVSVTAWGFTL